MKIIEKSQKPKKHPEEATERGSASPRTEEQLASGNQQARAKLQGKQE